ncbi:MAG: NAD-dependent epimerase/dehydratase family protein [Acidimicrobiia bacterium]|nr:NAD-dependent epimerase/dehydratase family protein [Acidimicrobiia bacterium]
MRRILVTGAATWTGGQLITALETRPDLEVIAVDEIPSPIELESEFHIFELDNPEFAHFVLDCKPHAAIHLQTVDRSAMLGGRRAHDEAVVGAQALFGAIRRCKTMKQVIVKSDLCVYGMGPRSPSVVFEDAELDTKRSRFAKDLHTVEGFTSAAAAARTDTVFTVLRFAPIFGRKVGNPISRYLRLPVVPVRLGYDPRLQLISGADAVRALEHTVDNPVAGTFNVAASGQLFLSRILRLGKRVAQPLPRRAYDVAVKGMNRVDLHLPEQIKSLIQHGMVADTRRMAEVLGFSPQYDLRTTVLDGYGVLAAGLRTPRGAAP